MKVLVPDIIDPAAVDLPEAEVVQYSRRDPIPEEHFDAEVLVTFAFGSGQFEEPAKRMSSLKLVQSLAAGVDPLLKAGFADDIAICSGVGLHDTTVAEHALALILAKLRMVPESLRAMAEHRWASELGRIQQPDHASVPVTSLDGARVFIWGFGSIGSTLAPHLTALGAEVVGGARSAGERHGYRVVGDDGVDAEIAAADVVVMILPGTDATRHTMDARRLALMKTRAVLVNVGRGPAVDPAALLAAVRSGRIAGAALDVTEPEPLPAESPLWDEPNVLITPHYAGGRPRGGEALIARNVSALVAGEPLVNVVER